MSSRGTFRRKVVLPVTVVRHNGQEKQLAHTLDMTENSARLGGLSTQLEVGEIIEVQRGAAKGKFQVFWMGAPGSAMAGQAGVRSLSRDKSIWGVHLPPDESDPHVNVHQVRNPMPPVQTSQLPGEKRWHTRYECEGSATVKPPNATYGSHGAIKDISEGGVYVEITAPLPVNTEVTLSMNVEGVWLDAAGMVRTSYPLVGMGISFQSMTGQNREKLHVVLERLKRKLPGARTRTDDTPKTEPALCLDEFSARVLAHACIALAGDFDKWKQSQKTGDVDDLRQAVDQLQRKLSPMPPQELMNLLASTLPRGTA